ncbi:MAG: hypothetical protein NWP83_11445 [Spirosomaceae bacterium]|nr:hypothetical protein [Spirosomataceae bacterium]
MTTIVLEIKDSKVKFFRDLIQNFSFVKVKEEIEVEEDGDSDEYIRDNIKTSLAELKDVLDGKTKGTPIREFLKEL